MIERITCTYEGGPLDGLTAYHIERQADFSTPILHRHRTGPKDVADPENPIEDRTAAGLYSIEERKGEFVAIHHPSDQDEEWHKVEKAKPEPPLTVAVSVDAPKKVRTLPDDHPLARRLAPFIKWIKANLEKQDGANADLH